MEDVEALSDAVSLIPTFFLYFYMEGTGYPVVAQAEKCYSSSLAEGPVLFSLCSIGFVEGGYTPCFPLSATHEALKNTGATRLDGFSMALDRFPLLFGRFPFDP